ncbi:MAG: hypothetical protein AAF495_23950 [Pseudomonadota bacterium]
MGKVTLLSILSAALLLTAAPAVADHLNGQYADNRGIQIDLRQSGNSVTGAVMEPNGQRTTLNGSTGGSDYVYGQVVGAHQGTFELTYQKGNPPSVQMLVYDPYGNLFDSSFYYRVAVPQAGQTQQPPAGGQTQSTGGGFAGGQAHGEDEHDTQTQTQTQSQGQQQQQNQQQPPAGGSDQGDAGSSLPIVD